MHSPEIPLVSAEEFAVIAAGVEEMFGSEAVERVFRDHGFSDRLLTDSTLQLPNAEYMRFLEACARQTGEPLFGAIIGDMVAFSDLGIYGAYVSAAPTLRVALARASRALPYHESGSSLVCSERGANAALTYLPPTPKALGSWHQSDGVAALLINLIRSYAGEDWRPDCICLAAATNGRKRKLEQFFDTRVVSRKFGTELRFASTDFANPRTKHVTSGNSVKFGNLRRLVQRQPPRTFAGTLNQILDPIVHEGVWDLDEIAAKIGMNPRTIQRRLKSEGTSFRVVIRDARRELAVDLISETDVPIAEIGTRLGYSSRQHFIRAFKKWTGATPGSLRDAKRD